MYASTSDLYSHPLVGFTPYDLRLDGSMDASCCASVFLAAVADGVAVRRVAARSHEAVLGRFPSFKMATTFPCESGVEMGALLLADVLEDVHSFRPQALRVLFPHQGRLRLAYPDVAIVRRDGDLEMWEAKPGSDLSLSKFEVLASLRRALVSVGICYSVRQPSWLNREPLATNAKAVWRHADRIVPDELVEKAGHVLRAGPVELGLVAERVGGTFAEMLALAARGCIAIDIGRVLLGDSSVVRLPLHGSTSGAFDGASVQGAD